MPQELPGKEIERDAEGTICFTKIPITKTNKIKWRLWRSFTFQLLDIINQLIANYFN